jgi:hypothetical protein
MAVTESLAFYLLIGCGVSVAVWLSDGFVLSRGERIFRGLSAVLFWPFYLPLLLLDRAATRPAASDAVPQQKPADDEMSAAIRQVESELDAAMMSLDGWAEDTLAGERDRLSELRSAWKLQAARIRELDRLLERSEPMDAPVGSATRAKVETGSRAAESAQDRIRQSEQIRRENIDRLRGLRGQMYDDLMGTLAWVRELVTMIHLAKYTGAPASRAEELVAQIAAAVEGLSEVTTWE